MATNGVGRDDWLATIGTEGDRLAGLPAESLDAPVPSLENWTVERVVRHVGRVHRWVSGLLAAPVDADPDAVAAAAPSLPRGPACLPAYREALDELVAGLTAADPDRPTASFVGPTQVRFWLRRQAHEVTVHRVDATDAVAAAGGPDGDRPGAVVAADGVAEWVEVFAATRHATRGSSVDGPLVGRSVGFEATDVGPTRWQLDFATEGTTWSSGSAHPDVLLAAPAADLLLTVWRRRPLTTVAVHGDRALAAAVLDTMRF